MKKDNQEKILTEIKKLLILALIKQGVQAKEVSNVLGVDPAIVSRIISGKRK